MNARPTAISTSPARTPPFTVEARDYDFKPVRTRIHVELCAGTGGRAPRRATSQRLGRRGHRRRRHGRAQIAIPRAGRLLPRCASARDTPEGRDVEQLTYLWVAGAARAISARAIARRCRSSPTRRRTAPARRRKVLIVTGKANTPVLCHRRRARSAQFKLLRSADPPRSSKCRSPRRTSRASGSAPQFLRNGVLYQRHEVHQGPAGQPPAQCRTSRPISRSTGPARRRSTRCRSPTPTASPRRAPNSASAWWTRRSTPSAATRRRTSLALLLRPRVEHGAHRGSRSTSTSTAKPASAACASRELRAAVAPGAAQARPHGAAQSPQGVPRYRVLGRRPGHRRRRQGAGQGGVPRFAHHLARHGARRHRRHPGRRRRPRRPSCART